VKFVRKLMMLFFHLISPGSFFAVVSCSTGPICHVSITVATVVCIVNKLCDTSHFLLTDWLLKFLNS